MLEVPRETLPTPGTFELIPYVVLIQDVPEQLLREIGNNITTYSLDYFNLPIRMEPGTFSIQ